MLHQFAAEEAQREILHDLHLAVQSVGAQLANANTKVKFDRVTLVYVGTTAHARNVIVSGLEIGAVGLGSWAGIRFMRVAIEFMMMGCDEDVTMVFRCGLR